MEWLAGITNGKPFWLGAGRSGRNTWSFLDGSAWSLPSPPTGLGNHVTSDKHGLLRAISGKTRMPFILQWRLDGSNPATLEARLSVTARTLESETPIYPAGTHFVEERAYLIVARESTWQEARQLAGLSGGHLAVISDTAESVHLRDLADQLDEELECWLGAAANADRWEWITGETWSNNQLPATSDGMAMVSTSTSWSASPSDARLGGFIIEWSRDEEIGASAP